MPDAATPTRVDVEIRLRLWHQRGERIAGGTDIAAHHGLRDPVVVEEHVLARAELVTGRNVPAHRALHVELARPLFGFRLLVIRIEILRVENSPIVPVIPVAAGSLRNVPVRRGDAGALRGETDAAQAHGRVAD